MTLAPFFLLLGAVLLGPVPVWLARASWPARIPKAAILLWQAIGLAAALALVTALLVAGLAPAGGDFLSITRVLGGRLLGGHPLPRLGPGELADLGLAAALSTWFVGNFVSCAWSMERRRRRHRSVIDRLTQAWLPGGARVLAEGRPVAYALPGRDWRLVVSTGAVELLDEAELAAVLAHERAHLRNRHDLVLLPFSALVRAIPLPSLRAARGAVAGLVEMVADDHAAAVCGRSVTAAALRRMRPELELACSLAARDGEGPGPATRLARLTSGQTVGSAWLAAVACAAAAALLVVPGIVAV